MHSGAALPMHNAQSMAEISASLKLQKSRSETASRRKHAKHQLMLIILGFDAFMLGLGFLVAYLIRFETNLAIFQTDVVPSFFIYTVDVLLIIPVWLIIFASLGLYHYRNLFGGLSEYTRIFQASTIGVLVVISASFFVEEFNIARGWILMAWFFNLTFVLIARFSIRRVVYQLRRKGHFLSPSLLVGGNGEARLLAHQLSTWQTSGLNLLGLVSNEVPVGERVVRNLYVLGDLKTLYDLVDQYEIEELILANSALSRDEILEIFQKYAFDNRVSIRFSSGLLEVLTTGLQVKEVAYTPLVGISQLRLNSLEALMKAMLDYTLTLAALFFFLPFFVLLALLVKLDSPGPIFYKRRVMGTGGTEFDAFKFRTMHINGDEILNQHPDLKRELELNHKLVDDPRITRTGKYLRKLSLDELPQLFNVLLGQMSLVGPRMISPAELSDYGQWDMNLLTVKPGITGLWQVSGRSDLSYEDRVRLDMSYIRNYSLWMDIFIILNTIPAVLKGKGAY